MSTSSNGTHTSSSPNANGSAVPKPRAEWIVKRREEAARTGDGNLSQMHFARQGKITEEMAYIARREKLEEAVFQPEHA